MSEGADFSSARDTGPAVRAFQLDVPAAAQSVNLFRGDVGFSLPLVELEHRKSPDVSITASYASSVERQVSTWNVQAPTGPLGLGWEVPVECVTLNGGPAEAPWAGVPLLVCLGGTRPLTRTGTDESTGAWTYATSDYQFWRVLYFPGDERWEVTTEDGIVRTVGGGLGMGSH